MEIMARALRADNGNVIEGHFCMHEFVKSASALTEEEKAQGTPIPPPVMAGGEGEGTTPEPTEYVCMREAIQTVGTGVITVNNGEEDVELSINKAVFTEIVQGSAKAYTGFLDKNGKKIYEGDKIRYQAGATSFETYTVVFNSKDGKFTVSPEWLWGCNFTPFDQRKVEVV